MPTYRHYGAEKYHFGYVYRVVYEYGSVFLQSKQHVEAAIDEKVRKLKTITRPVIVWGCADICMHLLAKVQLNVIHYVDIDPAFRGATIGGIPVLDRVDCDAPIIVMAVNQRTAILKDIRERGYTNEVIVI